MVTQHDALRQTLRERAAEIVRRVVIDERAGIDAHAAFLLDRHLREGAHERPPRLSRLVCGHAVLSDCWHPWARTWPAEIGESNERRSRRQPEGFEQSG